MSHEKVPKEGGIDNTISLSKEGYLFIKNRMEKYHTDVLETRLLGQKAVCITGKDAAVIFYDSEKFLRQGAAPKRVQKTLLGENAIQSMDGEAHIHRKTFFLSLLSKNEAERFRDMVRKEWEKSVENWRNQESINLFKESKRILCKTACSWAGVPIMESEVEDRAEDFASMVDGFGAVGARYRKGKNARKDVEDWLEAVIGEARNNPIKVRRDSILHAMASHKDMDGEYMSSHMAAIELINVIRPIVAISTYLTFMALALYQYPNEKDWLLSGGEDEKEMFVQEVRRYYPFTPFVGARVKTKFTWKKYEFLEGDLVLLDVYGIHHDSRIWENPDSFYPERFREFDMDPYTFIPHGGGNSATGHRCPGEGFTVEAMKATLDFLLHGIRYTVPKQDLEYDVARIPTYPNSGFEFVLE